MGGRTETKVDTTETQSVRVEELSYEETLRILQGQASAAGLADVSDAVNQRIQSFNQFGLDDIFGLGNIEDFTTFHATLGLFGKSRWNSTTNINDSGYQYQGDWLAVKWDRARYAIGIRELNLFSNTYTTVSEFVTVPYRAPGNIRKVALHADMTIPRAFTDSDPLRSWIEFYLTFDDGQMWYQIAPVSNVPSTNNQGRRIPVIFNINSPLPEEERSPIQGYVDTEEPVSFVRMRVRLTRPEGEDFDQMTPVLRGYRLKLSVGRPII